MYVASLDPSLPARVAAFLAEESEDNVELRKASQEAESQATKIEVDDLTRHGVVDARGKAGCYIVLRLVNA